MLIETLIIAGIMLIILPAVFYGYEKVLKEKTIQYFSTELTGIIEKGQLKALSHGSTIFVLVDNNKHQILLREGLQTLKAYPFDSQITVEKVTHDLKLTILANGHFLGAGKWRMTLGNQSRFIVFNVGEGRFYVQGE